MPRKSNIPEENKEYDISDIPNNDNNNQEQDSSIFGNLDEENENVAVGSTATEEAVNETAEKEESKKEEQEESFESVNTTIPNIFEKPVEPNEGGDNELFDEEEYNRKNIITRFKMPDQANPGTQTKLAAAFSNIQVDLNNIEIISEASPLDQQDDLTFIFKNSTKHTFPVVCCQSGYKAMLSALTLADQSALANPNLDVFQSRQVFYKIVYDKIENIGFKKPSFDQWLKITSFGDFDTLLFGIYCATFNKDNKFDIRCGKCHESTSVTVTPESMIQVKDRNVYEKIDEIIKSDVSGEELLKSSLITRTQRVMLNQSKLIFDIRTSPTLWDHLHMLKTSNHDNLKKFANAFTALLFISRVLVPDMRVLGNTGKLKYYEVSSRAEIFSILMKLSAEDGSQLSDFIEEQVNKLNIKYEIANAVCGHCKQPLTHIPINLENILFTRLAR